MTAAAGGTSVGPQELLLPQSGEEQQQQQQQVCNFSSKSDVCFIQFSSLAEPAGIQKAGLVKNLECDIAEIRETVFSVPGGGSESEGCRSFINYCFSFICNDCQFLQSLCHNPVCSLIPRLSLLMVHDDY